MTKKWTLLVDNLCSFMICAPWVGGTPNTNTHKIPDFSLLIPCTKQERGKRFIYAEVVPASKFKG